MFRILDIPWWYYAIAVVISVAVVLIWKKPALGVLAGYVFLVLAETVFIRKPFVGEHMKLELFWSWKEWKVQRNQILTNVTMFVPLGVLGGWLLRWKGLWIALGLSVVIEILQLITQRGLCEFDDVIHNMIGAVIGVALVMLINRVIREDRGM